MCLCSFIFAINLPFAIGDLGMWVGIILSITIRSKSLIVISGIFIQKIKILIFDMLPLS